jgi:hypothetical protein
LTLPCVGGLRRWPQVLRAYGRKAVRAPGAGRRSCTGRSASTCWCVATAGADCAAAHRRRTRKRCTDTRSRGDRFPGRASSPSQARDEPRVGAADRIRSGTNAIAISVFQVIAGVVDFGWAPANLDEVAVTVTDAFRIWLEHPPAGAAIQTEANQVPWYTNSNPDHQTEEHRISSLGPGAFE